MYCPVCKAEYRAGIRECADCHVALVAKLPEEGTPSAYAVVWKGENAAFATELVEELGSAGIESVAVPLDVLARNRRDFFDVAEKPLFGSAVSVRTRDYKAAVRIKERLLAQEPGEDEGGLEERAEVPGVAARVPEMPLDWDPASATLELWRGEDTATLKFVEDALHGVGIPTRQDAVGGGATVLFVRPEDVERGGEVVKEVLEARPPK